METTAPFEGHREAVRPEWIDYNGHMNVAYYVLAFDHATDALFDHLDLGRAYVGRANASVFVVESHIVYLREVGEGDPLCFSTWLLGADDKRLHVFHEMRHEGTGLPVATNELLMLHVDLGRRRAAPFAAAQAAAVAALAAAHAGLPRPAQAGRSIILAGR